MRQDAVLLAVAVACAGCASSEFSPSRGETFPPHAGPVELLRQLPPSGEYRMLGVVTVRGVALTSDESMFERLRTRAAQHGADAVVPQGPVLDRAGGEQRALAGYAIRRR